MNRDKIRELDILLRSIVYNILFYLVLIVLLIAGLPTFFFGRHAVQWISRVWARSEIWLLEVVCRTKLEFRGLVHRPTGPCMIAVKHQSSFETFALLTVFPDFTFVLKRELTRIPLFGLYLKGTELIAIDRSKGGTALAHAIEQARPQLEQGRQFIIFPEGTRRPVGAPPAYKSGVAHIYEATEVPCSLVALNTGLFWPRRRFMRWPGTIVIEFLPRIEPGVDRQMFMQLVQSRIESATKRLVHEALDKDPLLKRRMNLPPEEDLEAF